MKNMLIAWFLGPVFLSILLLLFSVVDASSEPHDPTKSEAPPTLLMGSMKEQGIMNPVFLLFLCFCERLYSASSTVVIW